jgi:hypothetical protein
MADENANAADLTFERCGGHGGLLPSLSNGNFPGNYETCGEAVFAGHFELIETVEGGAT